MRFWPRNNSEVNVGVGDFAPSGVGDPTERLDILDGRVRIRQLPTDAVMETEPRFVVTDANGVLGWRNIPTGTLGCEWNQWNASNHVRTAWAGAAVGCPDGDSRVGIGVGTVPGAKLHVYRTAASGTNNGTGLFEIDGAAPDKWSLRALAGGTGSTHYAVYGSAMNASTENYGVSGQADMQGGSSGTRNYGVYGLGRVRGNSFSIDNRGVHAYGLVESGSAVTRNYGVLANSVAFGSAFANYGVYAIAQGSGASTGYGIWARSLNATTNNWAAWLGW